MMPVIKCKCFTDDPPKGAGAMATQGIGELAQAVSSLSLDGYRIVTVIDTQNGEYHVVYQEV